jgi:DNA-binding LacI/PurR family transcriptional regulator
LGSFLSTLRSQDVPVIIPALPDRINLAPLPGGALIGPPEYRFSAVAFRSGAPEALLSELVNGGAVVMTLDYLSEVDGVDSVAVDCDAEADVVVEYLKGLGHRHIAYLAPREAFRPSHWSDGIDPDCRRFGRAMLWSKQRGGLGDSSAYHVECDMDPARSDTAVRAAVDRLWRLSPCPTALVCFDPQLAEQAMVALQARGLRCPSQVSIVVRDMAGSGKPRFTTLCSDPRRIGASAAEHIVNRLSNAEIAPARLLFASRLVAGATTGPAPPGRGEPTRSLQDA